MSKLLVIPDPEKDGKETETLVIGADPDREEAQQGADELQELMKQGFSGAWSEEKRPRTEVKKVADRGGMSKGRRKVLKKNKTARASRVRNRKKGRGKK